MMNSENSSLHFCLLIPCYDHFEGLIAALETVFYPRDLLIIVIVDDGSEIPVSKQAIKSRIANDYTLIIIRNTENKGITYSLNKGLDWIKKNADVKYIARLDCNDLCTRDRFFKQANYLDEHPDVGLLGSWCVFENKKKSLKYYYKTPTDHNAIIRDMHLRNILIHPTVMFRRTLLETAGNYPYDFIHAEDYAFFWQLIKLSHCSILNEFLVTCEINNEGISLKNRQKQLLSRIKVIRRFGTNPFLKTIGIIKAAILLLVPKQMFLNIKSLIKSKQ
jgi:glycosyltransferase involved in cell wall biosynthesis